VGYVVLIYKANSQDMERIYEDFQLVRPTIFSTTPRFWNVLYNHYKAGVKLLEDDPELQQDSAKFAKKEEELLRSIEGLLGGRLQSISSGGAATSPAILEFMHRCFSSCRVSNGYVVYLFPLQLTMLDMDPQRHRAFFQIGLLHTIPL
jgi:long-subunit acyl-CoA synthetase (AMP-forming)